jgi:serine phosphatase RsbU (regulator of sigma subunit)
MSIDARDTAEEARVEALHALNVLDSPREERYDRIVRLARQVFDVPMAAVNFVDADRQWTKAEAGLEGLGSVPSDDSMCRYTVRQAGTLVVPDTTADSRFRDNRFVVGDEHIRFYAGEPLRAPGGEPVGTLCLFHTRPRALSTREHRILQEMARWVERELAVQRELDRAAEVQQVLMPRTVPALEGYELAGRCIPTQAIGGDFFTWQLLGSGQLQLHVADVMGKGIPAALIAASVRAMLLGSGQFNDLPEAMQRTAAAAQDLLDETGAFVTVFSARLQPATGQLTYIDAGLGLAFIFAADGYRRLESSGPPLGNVPGTKWAVHTTTLAPGETLVVISDGFLDFFPTLEETLARTADAGLGGLPVAEMVDRAASYANAQGHPDDVTVLALRRLPG